MVEGGAGPGTSGFFVRSSELDEPSIEDIDMDMVACFESGREKKKKNALAGEKTIHEAKLYAQRLLDKQKLYARRVRQINVRAACKGGVRIQKKRERKEVKEE